MQLIGVAVVLALGVTLALLAGRRARITLLVVLGCLLLTAGFYGPYWNVAPGVAPAAIRAIRVGMRQTEVTAILGPPLRPRIWGPSGTILDYARPHHFAPWSSRLWVYFRDGHVDTVQGERVPFLADKRAVYLLRSDRPQWASDEFEATFQPWWRSEK